VTFLSRVSATAQRRWVRGWARLTLRAFGVRIKLLGQSFGPQADRNFIDLSGLVVANHVSWLDILAIDAVSPCRFIAKAEIRTWPLVGTLCERAGTLFIERGRRHAVHQMLGQLESCLRSEDRVGVFPEGTTSDGRCVLPFHANLIESAVRVGCPVLPLALRYEERGVPFSNAVEYTGETTFAQSIWRILGAQQLTAILLPLTPIIPRPGMTRHDLASTAQSAIRQALFGQDATRAAAPAAPLETLGA